MTDWQVRQRVLKATDREINNQAAATLHSFHNTSVEKSTLSTLQKEEREKKRMSQEQLHQYQAAFTGTIGKSPARRSAAQHGSEPSMDVTSGLSVSDAIANLNQQRQEEEFPVGGQPRSFASTDISLQKEEAPSTLEYSYANDKLAGSETTAGSMVLVDSPHDMDSFAPNLVGEPVVIDHSDDEGDEGDETRC
jgi:hypothetical protein